MDESSLTSGRGRRAATWVLAVLTGVLPLLGSPASATLPASPVPTLVKTLRTTPFAGSTVAVRDHEGLVHVARDNAVWLADDDGRSVYEVDATTGELRRRFRGSVLEATGRFGGGPSAGPTRTDDLQAVAYDRARDVLYVFSGTCCAPELEPTVFRFTRTGGQLELDSYQPLPPNLQVAAAAWNPGDGRLYIGADSNLFSYAFVPNEVGEVFHVPTVTNIYGIGFTPDGRDLFIARPPATINRVDWATLTVVPGWTLDLSSLGVLDARSVDVVDDRLWVSDGFDGRAPGDPLTHALFVFSLDGSTTPPGPPSTPPPPTNQPKGVNLVGNDDFERSLRGWSSGLRSELIRMRGGHSGRWAARVERTRGTGKIRLVDDPGWVRTTAVGTYTASFWVRSSDPGSLRWRLRELQGGGVVGTSVVKVRLTRRWTKAQVTLTVTRPGASALQLTASVKGAARGDSLDADDVRLTLG